MPVGHPIRLLLPDPTRTADLRAIADDDEEARTRLDDRARTGGARPVSAVELAAAKARAQEIGRAGEAVFCSHLERELAADHIEAFTWTADQNATSPYDFEVREKSGATVLIDVKSTTASFDGNVHISAAELELAATDCVYRIARVFDLEGAGGPLLRMSDPIGALAKSVRSQLEALPEGIRASKLEIHTRKFTWGAAQPLPSEED